VPQEILYTNWLKW